MTQEFWFVDQDGKIKSSLDCPDWCEYIIEEKETYTEVLIVCKETREVIDEHVVWYDLVSLKKLIKE